MEVEVGREESVQLEKDGGDYSREEEKVAVAVEPEVAVLMSGPPHLELGDGVGESLQQSEEAVKNLRMDAEADTGKKARLLQKLEAAREKAAAKMRQARKVIWSEKTQKELVDRAQFEDKMVFMLPEEWEAILKQVKDPKDKQVMGNMSLQWRDEMKRERVRYLFPEVLQILNENGSLTQKDMLGCRLACREWKDFFDLYYQNLFDEPGEREGRRIRLKLWNDSASVARFRRWCTNTLAAGENPFPTRKLSIEDPTPQYVRQVDRAPYQREVESVLREWGGEVWDLLLWFEADLNLANFLVNLQGYLAWMPNLRFLCIFWDHNIEEVMNQFFLPELTQLKVLHLCFVPPSIINGMLGHYESTLEMLNVNIIFNNPFEYAAGTRLPRLKKFDLRAVFFKDVGGQPAPLDWPALETIRLEYVYVEADQVSQIFSIVNGFKTTLRSVELSLHKEIGPMGKLNEEQLKGLRLDLPRVEKFSLSVCRLNLKELDFILPMTALKELKVTYVKIVSSFGKKEKKADIKPAPACGSINPEGIIQFSEFTNRLYESNIWTLLPDLRKVTINVVTKLKGGIEEGATQTKQKIYTREGYKQHMRGHGP